jgi:NNP family nitrate/nitrite transporter-like MFS transporter
MIGGVGGFVLPIAFGFLNQVTGLWTSSFMLLFVVVTALLIWMHLSIRRAEKSPAVGDALALTGSRA